MAYNLTLDQFENINLFSNRNLERVVSDIVNESANAVFVNMGEDAIILLDHAEGKFYIADYKMDKDNLRLTLENFEEINIEKDVDEFEKDVYEYFDDDGGDVRSLVESYKYNVVKKDKFIYELINEAVSKKNFETDVDYNYVKEGVDALDLDSAKRPFFEKYKERLQSHPLTEAKYFDWKNPVSVSLKETETKTLVNTNIVEKAANLWKKPEFKKAITESLEVFVENVEDGKEKIVEVFKQYPQVYVLDNAERRTMLGKAILSSSEIREHMDDILKGIDILFEKYELAQMKEEFLLENDVNLNEDVSNEDGPFELDENDITSLANDLESLSELCEDKTKEYVDILVEKVKAMKEEGTKPALVKEAVSLLSL